MKRKRWPNAVDWVRADAVKALGDIRAAAERAECCLDQGNRLGVLLATAEIKRLATEHRLLLIAAKDGTPGALERGRE